MTIRMTEYHPKSRPPERSRVILIAVGALALLVGAGPAPAADGSVSGVGPAGKTKAAAAPRARIGNQLRRIIDSPDPYGAQPHGVGSPAAARGSESGEQRIPVIVEPRVKNGWPQVDEAQIEALGGHVDAISRSWMRVHVAAKDVERLATHPDIAVMRMPAVPIPVGMGLVESESVELTGADHYHAAGIDGTGVRVAVVDAGFIGLSNSIAVGELPQNTTRVDFTGYGVESDTPHGTVVAEHLMDMAPGVNLTVIKVSDEVDVENAADYIRDHDIQLLNLSLAWVGRTYYDDTGPLTPIFNELHDVDGVFCAVAAGNYGQSHWRGTWIDEDEDGVLEFAPGVEQITVLDPDGLRVVFNWNQYGNSETDLAIDLIAVPIGGGEERVVATSDDTQNGPQDPVEILWHPIAVNETYSVRIRWVGGNIPPDLDMTMLVFGAHGLDHGSAASSMIDPAVGHGVFTVGAIDQLDWTLPEPPLEVFSSQGPTNDGRLKPDLVAPDGTSAWNIAFGRKVFGTSFSSPTTAGAAALLFSQDPSRTALDVADALHAGAVDKGAPGPDPAYGYGLLRLRIGEPPVATDDVAETDEDTAVNIEVLANDSDPDGQAVTVAEVDDPLHGTAQINGNQITYTPEPDFYGEDVFVYHAADPFENRASATVVVTVNPVQDSPRPVNDRAVTSPGTPVTIDVLSNDEEPDGEALTVVHVNAGEGGVPVSNGDGTVTYTPNPDLDGFDTFEYTAADPHGATGSATVEVWVSNRNALPVAVDDYETTAEDTAVVVDVLDNDYDYNAAEDELVITNIVQSADGSATLHGPTQIRFEPAPNFWGETLFSYEIRDNEGATAMADVIITVEPVNDAPTANDDSAETRRGQPVAINVLANDTDVDGDAIEIWRVGRASKGTASLNADNTITYTPEPDDTGNENFTYTIIDPHGIVATATVRVTIRHAPGLLSVFYNDFNGTRFDGNAPRVDRYGYDRGREKLTKFHFHLHASTVHVDPVTEGGFVGTEYGVGFAPGSDAAETFNDIIDPAGINELRAPSWRAIANFDGLDPTRTYRIALSANRGNPAYRNQRFTRVTLVGADRFTNASTPGVVVNSEASVSLGTGDNTDNGYVARWIDIRASDGRISVISEWDDTLGSGGANTKAYAMAYFKLEEWIPEPEACDVDADCDDGNLCTDDACDPKDSICTHAENVAPCDDGVDCTEDQCYRGTCQGTPIDALCDDNNVCTEDLCHATRGCSYQDNDGAECDDGIACTNSDTCSDQICVGLDACRPGTACDVDAGQCVNAATEVIFSAFNDLAWGANQRQHHITTITSPNGGSGLPSEGEMVDFETGLGIEIFLAIAGGTYNGGGQSREGRDALPGTDAAEIFGPAVDTLGAISYIAQPDSPLELTFSGLEPDRLYRLIYHGDRAAYGSGRDSVVTLVGAEGFRNQSSQRATPEERRLYMGANDASTWLPADNINGYVARFTEVDPGPDGEVVLHVLESSSSYPYKGKYGSAVLVQALDKICREDAECDDGNLCTLDVCNVETGQCHSSPQAVPCDDEIACTIEDMCQGDGSCAGTPDHGLCNDDNVCTDDVCDLGLGCGNTDNASPCDDGVACTGGDVCAGGECQGLVSCPTGEICDIESGQCIFEPECVVDADCDDGNDCTDNACDVESSQCITTFNQSPCDDGVGCTEGDACRDGACHGGAPNHDACNDGNACTDDVCDTDTGCAHGHNVDPCDDGVGCTEEDTCVEGLCAGHDTCPEDLLCDLEIGVCRPQTRPVLFRAYNDLAWRDGQLLHNITHITTPGSFLPAIGELVDYASGAPTGVMLAVAGGRYDPNSHGRDGRPAPAGTDAGDLFGGIVNTLGALTYVADYGSPLVLTLSGLDPEGNYAVAFHGDRGSYGWDRASRVTLVGAETFINESSAAQDNPAPDSGGALFSGADDASTRLPANNPNGYVARFVEIRPDDNGEIVLLIEPDGNAGARGKYASAIMLEQRPTGCQADADCDDANACTDDTCNLGTATCVHTPNQAVCDDGIACTRADECVDGVCVGGAPEDAHCDDDNVCTDDACVIGLGCVHQNVAGPCDDNSACTDNDTCADGICAGADTCPAGQSCDVESDQCVEDGGEAQPVFRAFNDLAWGGGHLREGITRITSRPGGALMSLPSTGELIDHASGAGTGVTLTVTGGVFSSTGHASDGRDAPDGTDAADLFGGIVSTQGAIAYVNRPDNPLVLTFTGMDPALTYAVALHADRGAYGWDRASLVTIGGADAFINASSEAADNPDPASGGALFAGPDDPSTRVPADNPHGYLARFTGIEPGDDGEITLTLTANGNAGYRGKYASAVMLEAAAAGCTGDAHCDDHNPCTNDICSAGRCASTPNTKPCDDGLACTIEDTCADAQCIGVEACPEGSQCDPESGECVASAAWDWMAYNDLYFSGTSNAPNTTRHDYRADHAPLLDFNTGAPLPVTVTGNTVGGYDPTLSGGDIGQATDADAVFGGIVSLYGSFELDAPNWQNVVTFDGLDPTKHYTVALTANRNSGRYQSARYTRVSIVGADAFVNESTLGIDINSPDSVSLSTGYNDRGLVARWTHITAADGSFSIVSAWDDTRGSGSANSKGYAMSVFQLIQSAAP